ncbi:Wound-induced proteinase inhibitor 1 [Nymphaea thermarum]|nr:Wound-induced proteinase inhibitor 1 [Nymphaea thermarum]
MRSNFDRYRYGITDSSMGGIRNCPHYKMVVVPGVVQWLSETLVSRVVSSPSERDLTCGRKDLGRSYPVIYRPVLQMDSGKSYWLELVGMDGQVAPPIIEAQNPYVKDVPIVKEGSIVLMDYRCDRVRVWVKPNDTIYKPPTIG